MAQHTYIELPNGMSIRTWGCIKNIFDRLRQNHGEWVDVSEFGVSYNAIKRYVHTLRKAVNGFYTVDASRRYEQLKITINE